MDDASYTTAARTVCRPSLAASGPAPGTAWPRAARVPASCFIERGLELVDALEGADTAALVDVADGLVELAVQGGALVHLVEDTHRQLFLLSIRKGGSLFDRLFEQ